MVQKFIEIYQYVYLVISAGLIIYSLTVYRKTRKIIKQIREQNEINAERNNLLSRENVKLRSENEILKDRLRNMGIKDFDVIN